MPRKIWERYCENHHAVIRLGKEVCPDCGQKGCYVGWNYSHREVMGHYHSRTGLKPLGPHRPLADELFKPYWQTCPKCKGAGLIDTDYGESWKSCPVCGGDMVLFTGNAAQREAIRQKILRKYPEAA